MDATDKDVKVSLDKFKNKERFYYYSTFIIGVVSAVVAAISTSIVALSGNWLLSEVLFLWHQMPFMSESTTSRIGCAIVVIALGITFYWLRERARFIYASLEMGAAAVTAYNAASHLYINKDSGGALLTLLGSVYIAVRACDNFSKWAKENEADYLSTHSPFEIMIDKEMKQAGVLSSVLEVLDRTVK